MVIPLYKVGYIAARMRIDVRAVNKYASIVIVSFEYRKNSPGILKIILIAGLHDFLSITYII